MSTSGMAEKEEEQNRESKNAEETVAVTVQNGQLSFMGYDCDRIPDHLAKSYGAVTRTLDLSFNRISTLDGLENFPNLEELILDNNEVDDSINIPQMTKLHTISLNKNRISDLESLLEQINKNCPSLTFLSLLGNVACPNQLSSLDKDDDDYRRYRMYVLYRVPRLKFLDSSPVKEAERAEAKRQGAFLSVVRPADTEDDNPDMESPTASQYTPLSTSLREGGGKGGVLGVSKYVYYGRHSEGNRFIKNNDL
ncbi:leucine-rich melanocyte differentiation-associated protein [Lingula anatina]|uniref:Leucine-rich melanocyte differentiation-associated protein n=1 Tax=Lingula anatina TaxID=7574 RepID=A0A1S3JY23_LINAN|nr:leucine-rich melanocyte differentiation-associated protein [Lingula anatina]|eukprot:XP_013414951.1 leucine-rich melanocyte differentiation-associated protein [Lingula anatina]